ncbi:MAG TPA: sigma-70 family RNA polymerase sigma factor, partial [Longimicrobiales bacterium]
RAAIRQERTIHLVEPQPVETDSDAARLVRRAQGDDRSAFDSLYAQHVGRVYAVCLRMCANRAEAERLTQDVFVRAWQNLKKFRGDSAFGSWLYRLAVNVVLQDGRSNRRRDAHVAVLPEPELFARASTTSRDDDRMDLERAIASLPPGARQVLVLHDIEGYKHTEIARMTGTAVGSVKAQLHRARKLLRERL